MTTNIAVNSSAPDPKDIRLLPQLGQAVLVGFNPNRDASDMVNEINEMVKKFAERGLLCTVAVGLPSRPSSAMGDLIVPGHRITVHRFGTGGGTEAWTIICNELYRSGYCPHTLYDLMYP